MVMSHHGRLLGESDAPVQGAVKIKFAIYAHRVGIPQQVETVTPLWSATYTVDVTAGLYAVTLGDVAQGDALPASVFSSAERFLGITIEPERVGAAEMTPRLQFGALPYAWRAERAAVAESLDCDGCVGIGEVDVSSLASAFASAGSYVQLRSAAGAAAQTGHIAVSGTVAAGSFAGDGSALTNLAPANIAGTVPASKLDLASVEESGEIDTKLAAAISAHEADPAAHVTLQSSSITATTVTAGTLTAASLSADALTAGTLTATSLGAGTLTSSAADGIAPLAVVSKTKVANLNADLVDGAHLDGFFAFDCPQDQFVGGFSLNTTTKALTPVCKPLPVVIAPKGTSASPAGSSCKDIRLRYAIAPDQSYWIDVDGAGTGTAPFEVYCLMSTAAGGGWTFVLHSNTSGQFSGTAYASDGNYRISTPPAHTEIGIFVLKNGDVKAGIANATFRNFTITETLALFDYDNPIWEYWSAEWASLTGKTASSCWHSTWQDTCVNLGSPNYVGTCNTPSSYTYSTSSTSWVTHSGCSGSNLAGVNVAIGVR
jgi:hypothetical protein